MALDFVCFSVAFMNVEYSTFLNCEFLISEFSTHPIPHHSLTFDHKTS